MRLGEVERSKEYERRADELRQQAEAVHDPDAKNALVKLAELWARLARRVKIVMALLVMTQGAACCAAEIPDCIMLVGHCIHCASGHCLQGE